MLDLMTRSSTRLRLRRMNSRPSRANEILETPESFSVSAELDRQTRIGGRRPCPSRRCEHRASAPGVSGVVASDHLTELLSRLRTALERSSLLDS